MANFYVGQRVRIVGCDPGSKCDEVGAVGKEAVITAIPSKWEHYSDRVDCDIRADGEQSDWIAAFYQLAPLTDPSADRFIESIKKLGREPINDVKSTGIKVKVTVTK